jgi:hypothetical protein
VWNYCVSLQLLNGGNCLQKLEAINLVQFNALRVISCTRCVGDRTEGNKKIRLKLLMRLLEGWKHVAVKINDALQWKKKEK